MKVLIADDSAFMRAILKDIVTKSNWGNAQVVEAVDGRDAVEKFKAEAPDLVLLDVIMPGQDGIAVLKEIGHSAKSVVIVSSVDQNAVIDEAKGLGAKDYIMKPFDSAKVLEVLNTLLPAQGA